MGRNSCRPCNEVGYQRLWCTPTGRGRGFLVCIYKAHNQPLIRGGNVLGVLNCITKLQYSGDFSGIYLLKPTTTPHSLRQVLPVSSAGAFQDEQFEPLIYMPQLYYNVSRDKKKIWLADR